MNFFISALLIGAAILVAIGHRLLLLSGGGLSPGDRMASV